MPQRRQPSIRFVVDSAVEVQQSTLCVVACIGCDVLLSIATVPFTRQYVHERRDRVAAEEQVEEVLLCDR